MKGCFRPVEIYQWRRISQDRSVRDMYSPKMWVPCGKCVRCLKYRSYDWVKRLYYEHRSAQTAYFVTLTYNEANVPYMYGNQSLVKEDYQKFMKRLRYYQEQEKDQYIISDQDDPRFAWHRDLSFEYRPIVYYFIGEYGTKTQRPHYHAILFGVSETIKNQIGEIWGLGNVKIGTVTNSSIAYVTNYVMECTDKKRPNKVREHQFARMSTDEYIGKNYVERNKFWHRQNLEPSLLFEGKKVAMPRTMYNKIFSDEHLHLDPNTGKRAKFQYKAWKAIMAKVKENYAKEKEEEQLAELLLRGTTKHEYMELMEQLEVARYNRNKKVTI